jgi:two-component system alkaline phosphatase synthesis response regulator PhoP
MARRHPPPAQGRPDPEHEPPLDSSRPVMDPPAPRGHRSGRAYRSGRILVVEDEEGLILALEDALRTEGYEVYSAMDGITGQQEAASGRYDLMILDVMLPGRDGFQVCQNLRGEGVRIPILMLTARSTTIDTVMGLRIGADDYLTKPFDMQVLLARLQALLRRTDLARKGEQPLRTPLPPGVYHFGSFCLDTHLMQLKKGEEIIPLNVQEYRLLEVFVRNPERVLTRDMLLSEAWGYDTETTTRTVDVHLAWLRQKLGEKDFPRHLVTVRGFGYKFIREP